MIASRRRDINLYALGNPLDVVPDATQAAELRKLYRRYFLCVASVSDDVREEPEWSKRGIVTVKVTYGAL